MILNKPITEMLIKQAEEKKDNSGSFRQGQKGKKKREGSKRLRPRFFSSSWSVIPILSSLRRVKLTKLSITYSCWAIIEELMRFLSSQATSLGSSQPWIADFALSQSSSSRLSCRMISN